MILSFFGLLVYLIFFMVMGVVFLIDECFCLFDGWYLFVFFDGWSSMFGVKKK